MMHQIVTEAYLLYQGVPEISLVAYLIETIRSVGPYGLLILFVLGLYKRWWVMGSEFRDLQSRVDRLEDLAYKGVNAAEKATTLAEVSTVQRKDIRRRASAGGAAE